MDLTSDYSGEGHFGRQSETLAIASRIGLMFSVQSIKQQDIAVIFTKVKGHF